MTTDPEKHGADASGSGTHLVFVYGTLLRGESNHHFLHGQRFEGPHVTHAAFTLYDTGPYPAATDNGSTALTGELYSVDAARMTALDELEDYPRLYTRQQIDTAVGAAWIYLWIAEIQPGWPTLSGDWRNRDSQG